MPFRRLLRDRPQLAAILGNTGWLAIERILRLGLGVVVMAVMARYLGAEKFGLFSFAFAYVALFRELSGLGLTGLVVRELVQDKHEWNAILGTTLALRLGGGVLAGVLATVVALSLGLGEPVARTMIVIMAVTLVFQSMTTFELVFEARVKSKYAVAAKGAGFLLGSTLKLALVLAAAPLMMFAWAVTAEYAAVGVLLAMAVHRWERPLARLRPSWARAKRLLRESWPLILSGVGAVINLKVDQVMLGEISGPEAVGLYAAAAQLSEVWYFVPTALTASAFPLVIRRRAEGRPEDYERLLQRQYDGLVTLAFAIALGTTFMAGPVITLIYGSEFTGSAAVLTIHIWAGMFMFPRAVTSKWLILEGLLLFSVVSHGVGAVVNVGANLLLIPAFGIAGAAVATVLSYATSSLFAFALHPITRPAARRTALALAAPVRLPFHALRRRS